MRSDPLWLFDGNGQLWLAREDTGGLVVEAWGVEAGPPSMRFEDVRGGWGATADHYGELWVAWSEGDAGAETVFVRRCADDAWGPRLQVSTTGAATRPLIVSDEYGNVWIFWERRTQGRDIVMCRMGARSGQETLVARDAARPRAAATRQGTLYVAYGEDALWTVTGTEHQGFGPPAPIAAG